MRKKIIIGNWKMYKTLREAENFLYDFNQIANSKKFVCDFGIAASFTNLHVFKKNKTTDFLLVAQNCHDQVEGAFTGEISTKMLEELAVSYVIIGHSERRQFFNETNDTINQKLKWIFNNSKLIPILCCGETLAQYENEATQEVIKEQITNALKDLSAQNVSDLVIAYEPIWAIGTGKASSPEIAQNVCLAIRKIICALYDKEVAEKIRIQYGGSVKPDNITMFLKQPDIDGALVGGASLKVNDFIALLERS